MANNPIVLLVRFLLELAGLFALGYWGWTQHTGALRVLLVILLPVLAATIWGVFRVPGHPGPAPVPVPGIIRLLIELVFFGSAIWALYASGRDTWGLMMAVVVILHYAASYDYIFELLRQRS
jgi:hypothetical protein